jgi:hypothetical protein
LETEQPGIAVSSDHDPREEESEMNDRQEAQVMLARLIIQKIRTDPYPSGTQMDLLEQMIPRALAPEYFDALLEKVAADQWPSNPMLARLSRLTEGM